MDTGRPDDPGGRQEAGSGECGAGRRLCLCLGLICQPWFPGVRGGRWLHARSPPELAGQAYTWRWPWRWPPSCLPGRGLSWVPPAIGRGTCHPCFQILSAQPDTVRVGSLIFLSGLLLSGCRNADFPVLTLCLATLPNLWMSSSSLLVAFSGYSI